jgi:hypothetical protein
MTAAVILRALSKPIQIALNDGHAQKTFKTMHDYEENRNEIYLRIIFDRYFKSLRSSNVSPRIDPIEYRMVGRYLLDNVEIDKNIV